MTATLTSPGQLTAQVRHLVGFTPDPGAACAVALAGKRVVLTMHLDAERLAAVNDDPAPWAQSIAAALDSAAADHVAIIGYGTTDQAAAAARTLAAILPESVTLLDSLTVTAGRWRSMLCHDRACCPPEGTPIPSDTPGTTAATVGGSAPLDTRSAIAAELDSEPADIPPVLEELFTDYTNRDRYLQAACASIDTLRARLTDCQAAARALPEGQRPETLAVCATLAYLAGDGARANVALDRLLAENNDPPTLAGLISLAITSGMHPADFRNDLVGMEI